jgi:hypothetical protein
LRLLDARLVMLVMGGLAYRPGYFEDAWHGCACRKRIAAFHPSCGAD